MNRRVVLAIIVWLAAIAVATLLDRPIAVWLHHSGVPEWVKSHKVLSEIIKVPGEFYLTAAVAIVVAIAHPLRWKAGGFVLLATAISGLNSTIKWIAGRTRPFKLAVYDANGEPIAAPFVFSPFRGGLGGMMEGKNLCFPSGHAALSFATAAAVAMLWPRAKWRWLCYAWAAVVAAERVAENAHWLSDCVAAAGLGVGGVYLIHWFLTKLISQPDEPTPTVPDAGDSLLQRAGERADAASARRGVAE
jgi:membrane-associated phospholipid phosphatase